MSSIPPLSNGLPRVDWEDSVGPQSKFSAIITEDTPITLLAGDSGCELVFEPMPSHDGGYPWACKVRSVRRREPPRVGFPPGHEPK